MASQVEVGLSGCLIRKFEYGGELTVHKGSFQARNKKIIRFGRLAAAPSTSLARHTLGAISRLIGLPTCVETCFMTLNDL